MSIDVPTFTFSDEELEAIKTAAGAANVHPDNATVVSEPRPKRRGRPPGSKNKTTVSIDAEATTATVNLAPAPLTKREEREVAERLVNILTGATGMAGMVKPYLPMTDEEAKAIAEPLSSYLVRNEPTNGIAREILENYDILAMILGVGAYSARVYSDRKTEVSTRRPKNTEAIQRISSVQESNNGRQPNERDSSFVSVPDASRSGSTPFDI